MEQEHHPETPGLNAESFYPMDFNRLIQDLRAGRQEFESVHRICLAWARNVLGEIQTEEWPDLFDSSSEPSPEISSSES